jgi:hypothetical protein
MQMPMDDFDIAPLPIIGQYNRQRFPQWSPEDNANWPVQKGNEGTKRQFALYPAMGRSHISYLGNNVLIFPAEPRGHFHSINYWYSVVGSIVYRVDANYNQVNIGSLLSLAGNVFFTYLVVNSLVFACFVDTQKIYIYQEPTTANPGGTFSVVTDPKAPGNIIVDGVLTKPGYIAAFGNRITVSVAGSSQFFLSQINLGGSAFNAATCFTIAGAAVFAQEDGVIGQMAVLNNRLYIFTDYTTGVWSNILAVFSGTNAYFPWKKSTSVGWDFGMADPLSLDVGFGFLIFLAQNDDGLLQVMLSNGDYPIPASSDAQKAIDVLFQRYTNRFGNSSPFLSGNAVGFIYQYENTIYYRLSGGVYTGNGILDQEQSANSIEYNFDTKTWHRVIELNGERNRIQRHIYFNTQHLVTVQGDNTVYQMGGQFYFNEITNPASTPQATDAYLQEPFRYERITPIISEDNYAEFETQYVEIDFVFGDSNINYSLAPFQNTQFIIDEMPAADGSPQYVIAEQPDSDGQPIFMVTEQGNTPSLNELTYNSLFKPSIELYVSDDGGISFYSADERQFSDGGVYQWRMRWYQLGTSRNRVYKLIAVSPVPITVLGGVMMIKNISGGAN